MLVIRNTVIFFYSVCTLKTTELLRTLRKMSNDRKLNLNIFQLYGALILRASHLPITQNSLNSSHEVLVINQDDMLLNCETLDIGHIYVIVKCVIKKKKKNNNVHEFALLP